MVTVAGKLPLQGIQVCSDGMWGRTGKLGPEVVGVLPSERVGISSDGMTAYIGLTSVLEAVGVELGALDVRGSISIVTPPPDVPTAITEITGTLDWMRRTKKTGGLGYSITQVQSTHAYRALVALRGSWP